MRAAVFLPSQKVFLLKKERTHPAARCFARRGGCLKWNGTLSERQALGCEDAFLFAMFFLCASMRECCAFSQVFAALRAIELSSSLCFLCASMRECCAFSQVFTALRAIEFSSSLCFLCASMRECFAFSQVFAALGAMRHSFHCGCAQHTQPLATISRLRASVSSGTICSASPTMP